MHGAASGRNDPEQSLLAVSHPYCRAPSPDPRLAKCFRVQTGAVVTGPARLNDLKPSTYSNSFTISFAEPIPVAGSCPHSASHWRAHKPKLQGVWLFRDFERSGVGAQGHPANKATRAKMSFRPDDPPSQMYLRILGCLLSLAQSDRPNTSSGKTRSPGFILAAHRVPPLNYPA